jgi:DamX protein
MGAESKTTIDKFAAGAGKGLKFYCYRTKLRGKPWFVVVAGPYADKGAAQAALNKLPNAVRKQRPWPRTLANVQADIRAHAGR